jgi:hypothetical protein
VEGSLKFLAATLPCRHHSPYRARTTFEPTMFPFEGYSGGATRPPPRRPTVLPSHRNFCQAFTRHRQHPLRAVSRPFQASAEQRLMTARLGVLTRALPSPGGNTVSHTWNAQDLFGNASPVPYPRHGPKACCSQPKACRLSVLHRRRLCGMRANASPAPMVSS